MNIVDYFGNQIETVVVTQNGCLIGVAAYHNDPEMGDDGENEGLFLVGPTDRLLLTWPEAERLADALLHAVAHAKDESDDDEAHLAIVKADE
jgi:hypothetical protein